MTHRNAEENRPVSQEVTIGEDLDFQRRWWRLERVIWSLFVVLIAAGLAGVFGRGPLSTATLGGAADAAVRVTYERIERTGTPSMLSITLGDQALHGGEARIFVSDQLISGLGAQRIVPQPAQTIVGKGGLTYRFPANGTPMTIRMELQPVGAGIFPFFIETAGSAPLTGRVVVLP